MEQEEHKLDDTYLCVIRDCIDCYQGSLDEFIDSMPHRRSQIQDAITLFERELRETQRELVLINQELDKIDHRTMLTAIWKMKKRKTMIDYIKVTLGPLLRRCEKHHMWIDHPNYDNELFEDLDIKLSNPGYETPQTEAFFWKQTMRDRMNNVPLGSNYHHLATEYLNWCITTEVAPDKDTSGSDYSSSEEEDVSQFL